MLVLASQSLTRKTLLENAGLRFVTDPTRLDEREIDTRSRAEGLSSAQRALVLAKAKAIDVSARRPDGLVIGSDQTLESAGGDLHKPVSLAAAADQLEALSGKTHHLHSAVALVRNGEVLFDHVSTARLTLKPFSRERIDAVLALEGENVLASVGGYRLEGPSIRLFETIEGDYFTILGLPVLALLQALETIAPELL